MSTDTYRTPGRAVDETEIEREKVRQAAETKRKAIEEREATRRARIKEQGPAPLLAGAVLGMIGMVVAGVSFSNWVEAKHPKAPDPCVERVEVISHSDSSRECHNGGHIETSSMPDGQVLWRCLCGRTSTGAADGGT